MATTRRQEERALDADERELVARSHHPQVQDLSDEDLSDLLLRVRERRDRAKSLARGRRREIRGKSDPRGAKPASEDAGSKLKLAVLAAAVRRLNTEFERRRKMAARAALVESAQCAFDMKRESAADGQGFNSRAARAGMRAVSNRSAPNIVRPMERGRLRKAASVAQARRDAR